MFDAWVWAFARNALKANASLDVEYTVQRIASAICDAVVTLGSDQRICERAPVVSNLLVLLGAIA